MENNKSIQMYEFMPNETGLGCFRVVSHSKKEAIESLKKLPATKHRDYFDKKGKYTIKRYGINKPSWDLVC